MILQAQYFTILTMAGTEEQYGCAMTRSGGHYHGITGPIPPPQGTVCRLV